MTLDDSRVETFDRARFRSLKLGRSKPLYGLGAGDSALFFDVLPKELAGAAFGKLKREAEWVIMRHKGGAVSRLVAAQGTYDMDGQVEPIYRHPADELPPTKPWTRTLDEIRPFIEKLSKHRMNHALIQWYRGGSDHITPHSDKTIDIKRETPIVNLSLGAERVMMLREKMEAGKRRIQRITLPHNSLFLMGWKTNREWLHGINRDNRPLRFKSAEEKVEGGHRISLTFRQIATFFRQSDGKLYGQGAPSFNGPEISRGTSKRFGGSGKWPIKASSNENDDTKTVLEKLFRAFGKENWQRRFNWEENYGMGSSAVWINKAMDRYSGGLDSTSMSRSERPPELKLRKKGVALIVVSTRVGWPRIEARVAAEGAQGDRTQKTEVQKASGMDAKAIRTNGTDTGDVDDGFVEVRRRRRKKHTRAPPSTSNGSGSNKRGYPNPEAAIRHLFNSFQGPESKVFRLGVPKGTLDGEKQWSAVGLTLDEKSIQDQLEKVHTIVLCGANDMQLLQSTAGQILQTRRFDAEGKALPGFKLIIPADSVSVNVDGSRTRTSILVENLKNRTGSRIVKSHRDVVLY